MTGVGVFRAVLATGNPHKVTEVESILGSAVELTAVDTGVAETGNTFEENALVKARAACARTGVLALADDSGIEIDAIGGAPGIHSARWTEEHDWIPRVLRELDGVPPEERTARFVSAAAAAWPDGRTVVRRGVVEGHIAFAARGPGGFGYDPIFVPVEGDGRTFGEMSADEKHALSHRGRAFRALGDELGLGLTSP
jgi:XTP/dITP diphosphohydrolase